MTSHAITNAKLQEPVEVGSHATATAPVFESLSVLDMFKIGIGPSSSHTIGPMRAALDFVAQADASGRFDEIVRLRVDLLGSLGATGSGHGTDTAIMLGLAGLAPDTVETPQIAATLDGIRSSGELLPPDRAAPIVTVLDGDPNALAFLAAVNSTPLTALGVTSFGQSGALEDVYGLHEIDAETVVGAALDLI